MTYDFEIKLLDLTRNRDRVTLAELADQLRTRPEALDDLVAVLNEKGLLSISNDVIELNGLKRMSLADYLIRSGRDPEKVSRFFRWQEFEDFAVHTFEGAGYRTQKHLVFKSRAGRREIDLLAWNDNFILTVDCKHWARRLATSRLRNAATAQHERTELLAERSEVLDKHGLRITVKRDILPVIVTLVESQQRMMDGVPIVPILKLPSFLYGLSPVDETLRMVPVQAKFRQSTLA